MIYVFFATGTEEIEALATVDILRRAGLPVEIVSITNSRTVVGAHGIRVEADKLLKDAGIKNKADKTVGSFSAGEAVKAEISFALARRPKLLIMDEPLANLDPVYKTDILELLQDAVSANDLGILLSTHLLDEIEDITDKIYIMENGKITKSGDRFEMLGENEDKQLRDLAKG